MIDKNNEHQERYLSTQKELARSEIQTTPEQIAEKNAMEKLELLKSAQTSFAIRFVNPEEYKEVVASGKLRALEIIVLKNDEKTGQPVSFREFLKAAVKKGWAREARELTDWGDSTRNLADYEILITLLKAAHSEAIKEGTKNIRNRTLQIFREKVIERATPLVPGAINPNVPLKLIKSYSNFEKHIEGQRAQLLKYIPTEVVERAFSVVDEKVKSYKEIGSLVNFITEILKRELSGNVKLEDKSEVAYLIEFLAHDLSIYYRVGPENINIAQQFRDDPEFLLRDEANLRKFIEAASTAGFDDDRTVMQYQLAMILSTENIRPQDLYQNAPWSWAPTDSKILGVITLLPNKDIQSQLTEISSHAPEGNAHPVFDKRGVVRWPVNKDVFGIATAETT